MTLLVVLLGAMFGVGVFGLARFVVGSPDTDAPGAEPAESQKSSQHRSFGDRFDRLGLRLGLGATAAVAVGVLTGWPVGVLLAAASAFFAPSLLGGRARRGEQQARLEAIATWTEQLRDVMAAAAGLEQAIVTTAAHAPPAIRPDVAWLAASLQAGTSVRNALRRFAQRLDDPAGDLVVAALILAAEGSPRQLGDLLGRLAATTRDTVKMRLRIETGRARVRSSVQLVTAVTVVFSFGIVVLNPTYVQAYRSPTGQLVMAVVALLFAGAYWWLARAARPTRTGRFLTGAPGHGATEADRRRTTPTAVQR